jgi:hypothetical protein
MIGEPERKREESQERHPPQSTREPVVVRVFRALKRQINRTSRRPEKNETPHQINERMMARWTRRVGWFTGALVVVSAVTACIFWRQLNVMQDQFDEMRSPSAERPYLFVSHDDSKPPGPPEPITPGKVYLILFKNYGKTPAMYRGIQARCGYFQTNPPAITFTNDKWASTVIVGPNETIGPLECPLIARAEEIALAEKDIGFLFLAGKIIYDDLAGRSHETVFCMIYKPATKGFGLVPNDNSCNYYK